jgi:cyclopropane-fatty-acyl-phospholipid synthase
MIATGLARRIVLARLEQIEEGQLTIMEPGATHRVGTPGALTATFRVHDQRAWRSILLGGHLGAADAYVDGWWASDDLTTLVRLLVRNRDVLDGLERGWVRLLAPFRRLGHALHRNTRPGSRRNIAAHYDLGNEFFATFLDESLTYSSGIFPYPGASLALASESKYERICRMLELDAADHMVEIGTGWGGFALFAAGRYGCRVTTTTISAEQHREATARVERAGLADRVTVLRRDYRDLEGRYDKLVSIEMVEAVGHEYLEEYFATCARLLAPDGLAAIQAITIQDRHYDRARREVDFIKREIFPGSCIPSIARLTEAARHTDLRLVQLEDITPHYAETLRCWRENFRRAAGRIAALGFPPEFQRAWEFYFSYCEGGFREAAIGDVQLLFAKPRALRTLPAPAAPALELVP